MYSNYEDSCFFISYKNYVAKVYFDYYENVYIGKVVNCEDFISFRASTLTEVKEHFYNHIDDYLDFKNMLIKNEDVFMSNKKNNIKDKIKALKKELPFKVKGEVLLFLNEYDEIDAFNMEKNKYWCEAMSSTSANSDLIDGMDFLQKVKNGGIANYDGYISKVYINKFISNLGLATPYFQSGGFMVSEKQWEELCDCLEVVVDWVNK